MWITINFHQSASVWIFFLKFVWQPNWPNFFNVNAFWERSEDMDISLWFSLLYQILYLCNGERHKIMQREKYYKCGIFIIKNNILVCIFLIFYLKVFINSWDLNRCFIWCQKNTFNFSFGIDSKPGCTTLWQKKIIAEITKPFPL